MGMEADIGRVANQVTGGFGWRATDPEAYGARMAQENPRVLAHRSLHNIAPITTSPARSIYQVVPVAAFSEKFGRHLG